MTTYRPGYQDPYKKHKRQDKRRDHLFSDESGAASDWIPVQPGDTLNLQIYSAHLEQVWRNNSPVADEYLIIGNDSSPTGNFTLEMKLGGADDRTAVKLARWDDRAVAIREKITIRGFIRVRLQCRQGDFTSEVNQPDGSRVSVPVGIGINIDVLQRGQEG